MKARANIQDEAICAFCTESRDRRCRPLRGGQGCRQRADFGGSWRRCDQAKDRAAGPGKSGGFRTLIVYRARARAVFVHGFAKNEKDNVGPDELAALRKLAAELFSYDDKALRQAVGNLTLMEVICDEKAIP